MAKTLAQKMLIKAGMDVVISNAPGGLAGQMGELPEGVTVRESLTGAPDVLCVFVRDKAALAQDGPAALAAVKPDGVLWFAYPKKSSGVKTDITRDVGWDVIRGAGWRPVTQIAIDAVWSALRFRPEDRVKSTR